jgi:CRISPR-associated protein Cas2
MWILVTYDVNTEDAKGRARLRKVAKVCEGYGQRVQKSVFECIVNQAQYEAMKRRLLKLISQGEDSLRFYRLPESRQEQHVEAFGIDKAINFREPLIV